MSDMQIHNNPPQGDYSNYMGGNMDPGEKGVPNDGYECNYYRPRPRPRPVPGGYQYPPGTLPYLKATNTSTEFTIEGLDFSSKVGNKGPVSDPTSPAPTSSTDDIPAPEVTDADQNVIDRLELSITNSVDALFEIYTLLQLMQECANKQRAAAREARQSEYTSEKTSIQRQADTIRNSAIAGLVAGCIGSAISLSSLATSGWKLGKGTTTKLNLINKSDVPTAASNLHDATKNVNTLANQMNKFKEGLPTKPPAAPPPGQEAVPPPPPKPAPNGPNAPADTGKPNGPADAGKPNAPADAGKTPDAKQKDDKPKFPPNVLDDNIDEAAMKPEQKAQWKELCDKYQKADNNLTKAQGDFDKALEALHSNPEFIEVEKKLQTSQSLQTFAQTFATLFNTLSQGLSQLIQANATLEQINQKDSEQEAEQESDLFKNAGELRQAVLQLMSAVTQVEKDSLNKIINA